MPKTDKILTMIDSDISQGELAKKIIKEINKDADLWTKALDKGKRNLVLILAKKNKDIAIQELLKHVFKYGLPTKAFHCSDSDGQTVLHYLVKLLDEPLPLIKQTCEAFPSLVNRQDRDSNTPVHLALEMKKEKTLQYMMQTGTVKLELTNSKGQTALDLANGDSSLMRILVSLKYKGRQAQSQQLSSSSESLTMIFPRMSSCSPKSISGNRTPSFRAKRFLSKRTSSSWSLTEENDLTSSASRTSSLRDLSASPRSQNSSQRDLLSDFLDSEEVSEEADVFKNYEQFKITLLHLDETFWTLLVSHGFGKEKGKLTTTLTDPNRCEKLLWLLTTYHNTDLETYRQMLDQMIYGFQNQVSLVDLVLHVRLLRGDFSVQQQLVAYYIIWKSLVINFEQYSQFDKKLFKQLKMLFNSNKETVFCDTLQGKALNDMFGKLFKLLKENLPVIESYQTALKPVSGKMAFNRLFDEAVEKKPNERTEDVSLMVNDLISLSVNFYVSVPLSEFYNLNKRGTEKAILTPRIDEATNHFNRFSNFLMYKILTSGPAQLSVVQLIIEMVRKLWDARNQSFLDVNHLMAIASAFNNTSIERLSEVFDRLSEEDNATLKDLDKFVSHEKNSHWMRLANRCKPNTLPFLGQLLTDIVRIIEASKQDELGICESLGNSFTSIIALKEKIEHQLLSGDLSFWENRQFKSDLPSMLTHYKLIDDKTLDVQSRALKPRGKDILDLDIYHNGCKNALHHMRDEYLAKNLIPYVRYKGTVYGPSSVAQILLVWFRGHFQDTKARCFNECKVNKLDKNKRLGLHDLTYQKYHTLLPLLQSVLTQLSKVSGHYPMFSINDYYNRHQGSIIAREIESYRQEYTREQSMKSTTKSKSRHTLGRFFPRKKPSSSESICQKKSSSSEITDFAKAPGK